jgi:hypothetical protein
MEVSVSFMHPQGKGPQYPCYTVLGGPLNQSAHFGEVKNWLSLPGMQHSPVGVPTVMPAKVCPGTFQHMFIVNCNNMLG